MELEEAEKKFDEFQTACNHIDKNFVATGSTGEEFVDIEGLRKYIDTLSEEIKDRLIMYYVGFLNKLCRDFGIKSL